jgi:hypothetical protein
MHYIELDPQRLERAKKSFSTRRVIDADATGLITDGYRPRPGDLVLATVEKLGQHTGIQLRHGRRARIYPGEQILLAYGSRYAPDQFEALIPEDLGACDLAAAGGLASRVVNAHSRMKSPTRLSIDGVLAREDGTPLNLAHYALTPAISRRDIPVFAVVGTSMNAGKTTTAAGLVHGLQRAGLRVGAAKITGTGACADFFALQDAGAEVVWDFTDAGHVTTYGIEASDVTRITEVILSQIRMKCCDVAVLEIADGVFQRETAAFLETAFAHETIDGLMFAAGDAAGAIAGSQWLKQRGHRVIGLSGVMTLSELQMREAAQITGTPVYTVHALRDGATALDFLEPVATISKAS